MYQEPIPLPKGHTLKRCVWPPRYVAQLHYAPGATSFAASAANLLIGSRVSHGFYNPSTEGHAVRGWGGVGAHTTRRGVRQAVRTPPLEINDSQPGLTATLPGALHGGQPRLRQGSFRYSYPQESSR